MLERKITGYFRDAKKGFEIQAETIYEFAEYVLGSIFWVLPDRIGLINIDLLPVMQTSMYVLFPSNGHPNWSEDTFFSAYGTAQEGDIYCITFSSVSNPTLKTIPCQNTVMSTKTNVKHEKHAMEILTIV